MLKCLAIDDEYHSLQLLCNYISDHPRLELSGQYTDPLLAREHINNTGLEFDILFIDVEMPGLTGFQLLNSISRPCAIVLVTAYLHYAYESYEYNTIDYLHKPVTHDRFLRCIYKIEKKEGSRLGLHSVPDFLFIKSDYRIIQIPISSILYLEGLRDYVAIHTENDKVLSLQSLKSFEVSLKNAGFFRIHKSYIINLKKVNSIEKGKVMIMHRELPLSELYKTDFLKMIKPI